MPLISDNYQIKKLNKYKINIKTKYIVGNDLLERNTDNTKNDDIKNGIRCKKEYYLNNNLTHTEDLFDSRIEYTFISKDVENKDYTCPNCGMHSKLKDFIDGCPYCQTYYNIDYTKKDLGSKYHYDQVLRSNTYKIVTGIVDVIISLILSYIFIKTTSRTFNGFDISKIFIYGLILSLILYYFFYIIDAYIVLTPIKNYKEKENQKQEEFWESTKIDKKKFYNNLNYELRKYYYSKDNIIDYDIIDYLSFNNFTKNNQEYIKITAEVRVVYYKNNKITSRIIKDTYLLKHHTDNIQSLKEGENIIKCHNCGASIDITQGECSYCHTKTKYLQEWTLITK